MIFTTKKINPDEASIIIKTTENGLADAQEAVNENLYWQTLGLEELRKSPGTHKEAIATQKKDIAIIQNSVSTVGEKIKRINRIAEQKKSLFFCISKTTTPAEIKVLMTEIELALKNTKNPAKIQLLETVRETAETCKELISQGVSFDDQYFPLLESEQKYARTLITNGQLDALKQSPNVADSIYFSIIKDVYNQSVDSKKMLGLTGQESKFMKTLQAEIEAVIRAPSSTPQHTAERLQKALHTKINALVSNLESNKDFSYAFKKFINHVCKSLKIISPIFEVTDMKEGMAQKFRDIKTTLQDNKATQPAIDDIENIEKNNTINPIHKGSFD